jgi:pSer/pThr/pTyr-binding forkhead associated (FHA) protein
MGHNLEVPEGHFVIGRSSSCQLSLDDALVSRRHALLTVTNGAAHIEDLGSRNGVSVNSKKIAGQEPLADGDLITIGSQTMTIHGLKSRPVGAPARRPLLDTMTAGELYADEPTETSNRSISEPDNPDKRVHELSLIGAVADKALALGRPDDAIRLLERPLHEMLARAKKIAAHEEAAPIDDLAAKRAVALALKLAAATGNGEWIDFVLELYSARAELLPQSTVDELYSLVRRVRVDVAKLKDYIKALAGKSLNLNKNERFLLSRVEGLVELAALK